MKSQGIMCSSTQKQTGQHSFLFSLRSLEPNARRKINISLEFPARVENHQSAPMNQKQTKNTIFDISSLLPCFSKGSQAKLNGFMSVFEEKTFQSENKAIIEKFNNQNKDLKEENHSIMEAKPRSTYCQICKQTFSDYLKHLNHPIHIKKFETQCKNTMIDDLVKGLERQTQPCRRGRRQAVNEQYAECQGAPCKIRVIQMQDTLTPIRVNNSNLNKQNISSRIVH